MPPVCPSEVRSILKIQCVLYGGLLEASQACPTGESPQWGNVASPDESLPFPGLHVLTVR